MIPATSIDKTLFTFVAANADTDRALMRVRETLAVQQAVMAARRLVPRGAEDRELQEREEFDARLADRFE